MWVKEHTIKVTERLQMISANSASIQVDWDTITYTNWNDSFWIEIPKEDLNSIE